MSQAAAQLDYTFLASHEAHLDEYFAFTILEEQHRIIEQEPEKLEAYQRDFVEPTRRASNVAFFYNRLLNYNTIVHCIV
jgi:hypothetical protein